MMQDGFVRGRMNKDYKPNDDVYTPPELFEALNLQFDLDDGTEIKITNRYVKNYIPNFKTTRWDGVNISSHGYVKEVANNIKKFSCF